MNIRSRVLAVLNFVFCLAAAAANVIVEVLPRYQPNDIGHPQLHGVFIPFGATIFMGTVIYVLLGIFTIYGLIAAYKPGLNSRFIDSVGVFFIIACAANCGWIMAWHYQMFILSIILISVILICTAMIYFRLHVGLSGAPLIEQDLVHVPFSVYLAWISLIMIANMIVLLLNIESDAWGTGNYLWVAVLTVLILVISVISLFKREDIYFAAVMDWGLFSLFLRAIEIPAPQSVIVMLAVTFVLVSGAVVLHIRRRKSYGMHKKPAVDERGIPKS